LASYSLRVGAGTRLYEQGSVSDRFYVVLRGEVLFEVLSEAGEPLVVARAAAGDLVGHVVAFTQRPASAAARVEQESVVLAIPVDRMVDAVREAPELALQLIIAFAGGTDADTDAEDRGEATIGEVGVEAIDGAVDLEPAVEGEAAEVEDAGVRSGDALVPIAGELNTDQFFVDTTVCPVSQTRFQFPRVRTRAVRPTARDSDFHVQYQGVDPTKYGIVVCPSCAYAAYFDDFAKLDEVARTALWDDRHARVVTVSRPLNGTRSSADSLVALELAMRCYELRGAGESRRAVLQHRRAWFEREAGNTAEEMEWLFRAREAYMVAYEHDVRISEESAARVAYLVGDLSMRLSDYQSAAQWLETAVRVAPASKTGIVRTARDRLQDVRRIIKQDRMAS
jgi:uncharacterized protein (DUF2225 family)